MVELGSGEARAVEAMKLTSGMMVIESFILVVKMVEEEVNECDIAKAMKKKDEIAIEDSEKWMDGEHRLFTDTGH
jgi:hypothetical protein